MRYNLSRTKKTLTNALSQALIVGIQSIFSLIVTREIIVNIGSDYNGLNSTATQILTVLSLIEGGFTLATLVKLYRPYNEGNFQEISKYISLSKKKYERIGLLYFVVGAIIALAYTPFVKTNADAGTTSLVMLLTVFSSAFSIFYISKYRLLFQVSQTEYKIYYIQFIANILMYLTEIVLIRATKSIIYARICIVLFQCLAGVAIGFLAKKQFPKCEFDSDPQGVDVAGTKDVFISKLSGMVYSSASVFFISSFVGTAYTSVYSVYNSIINMISNYVSVVLSSPRNALGQIINGNDESNSRLKTVFEEYEFIATFAVTLLASVTYALIIPFVRMYTNGIADVNYVDDRLAVLMVLTCAIQMIHIPSGTCIEVAGHFKAVKYIQMFAMILMVAFSIFGVYIWGLYGILLAKLITSIALAILEITYVRKRVLNDCVTHFCIGAFPTFIFGVVIAFLEKRILYAQQLNIITFVLVGCLLLLVNVLLLAAINMIFNEKVLLQVLSRFLKMIRK